MHRFLAHSEYPTGLHDLRYKAKVLHRDVSINNIMYDIRDGAYYFVLIDFDMAIVVEDHVGRSTYQTSSKHRTGTLPFMAYELIEDAAKGANLPDWKPLRHLLRHDYESLFYVSFWSVTAIPSPKKQTQRDVLAEFTKALEQGGPRALARAKRSLLIQPLEDEILDASPAGEDLASWFVGFSEVFGNAVRAINSHRGHLHDARTGYDTTTHASFDFETLNGLLTKDTLKANLTPRIPAKSLSSARNPPKETPVDVSSTVPAPAVSSDSAAAVLTNDADGKRETRKTRTAVNRKLTPDRAQDELPVRRRNARKTRMTAQQALAAKVYVDTRLRSRKPRV